MERTPHIVTQRCNYKQLKPADTYIMKKTATCAAVIIGLLLAGCGTANPQPEPVEKGWRVTQTTIGGECVTKSAQPTTCSSTIIADTDTMLITYVNANGTTTQPLAREKAEQIRRVIPVTTGWPINTGTCPTAYDGQEIVYEWKTPYDPATAGSVSSCSRVIPENTEIEAFFNTIQPAN
jgi:hypothetical protein